MKRITLLSLLSFISFSFALGQSGDENKTYRPDIPGSFIIDFGFNNAQRPTVNGEKSPKDFKTGFFGSSTVNVYYQYPLRLGKSKFSFNPGAGFSFERFRFTNGVILDKVGQRYELVPGSNQFDGIQKTILSEKYFDIPVEFRFDSKPEDIATSFNIALGGRAGYMFDSMMKVKYIEDGEKKTNKDKQNFNLNQFRYGVYSRIGFGAFNLFFFYNLSPVFQPNVGPERTTMTTITTGISINGF